MGGASYDHATTAENFLNEVKTQVIFQKSQSHMSMFGLVLSSWLLNQYRI